MFKLDKVKTFAEIEVENKFSEFKSTRANLLNSAVVTTQSGNKFDADEKAQVRMNNVINACTLAGYEDNFTLEWSLADTPSGVGTEITLSELKEAYILAVQNMSTLCIRQGA